MRLPPSQLSAHSATPLLAALIASGLVGRAEALSAFLNAVATVAVSSSGRQTCGSRSLGVAADPVTKLVPLSRGAAALAARTAVAALLERQAPRHTLRPAAVAAAFPQLCLREIEDLTTCEIARHLRVRLKCRIRPLTSVPPAIKARPTTPKEQP